METKPNTGDQLFLDQDWWQYSWFKTKTKTSTLLSYNLLFKWHVGGWWRRALLSPVQERARGLLSPCQVWWGSRISPAAGVAKNVEFFVCLSVCLSVCSSRFWKSETVRPISAWRHWSTETILIPLDRGRFVAVHPCSTFSHCCQLATPLNAEDPRISLASYVVTGVGWGSIRCWRNGRGANVFIASRWWHDGVGLGLLRRWCPLPTIIITLFIAI